MEKHSDIDIVNESLSEEDSLEIPQEEVFDRDDIDIEEQAVIGKHLISLISENIDMALTSQFYSNRIIDVNQLTTLINKESNHGLTGLKNLGNSCYMSTIIQCLSHSLDFLYYILSRGYTGEKPKKICDILNHIFTCLWVGNDKYYTPTNLRHVITGLIPGFNNTNQQDSNECMLYLLDALHDELNIQKIEGETLYCPPKFKDESEISASKRFWNHYKEKNNSVIVDLFHGQFMNTITCLVCYYEYVTFEPFVTLPIPIPHMKWVDVTFVPLNSIKSTIKLALCIPDTSMFYNMEKYLNKYTTKKITQFRCLLIHGQTQTARFVKNNDLIYQTSKKGHIFIYEFNDDEDNDDVFPIIAFIRQNGITNSSYPRVFPINNYSRVKQLRMMIYGNMKKYYENINQAYSDFIKKYNGENTLEPREFETIISEELSSSLPNELPYEVYLVSQKEDNVKKLFFSGKGKQDEYLNSLGDNQRIENLLGYLKHGYKLIIEVNDKEILTAMNKSLTIKRKYTDTDKVPTLTDCIDAFTNYEKLEKGNDWYCSHCKKIQNSLKKIELFYIPKYFIITLKRYESKLISKTQIQLLKNNVLVTFPINKFDLSRYCIGPKNPQIYELYALSQHSGSVEGGHYATACRNFGKWYEFDDISVFPSDEETIVGSEAYILFYRRNEKN
jgi:ubiquitin C-terminal hydrolase